MQSLAKCLVLIEEAELLCIEKDDLGGEQEEEKGFQEEEREAWKSGGMWGPSWVEWEGSVASENFLRPPTADGLGRLSPLSM